MQLRLVNICTVAADVNGLQQVESEGILKNISEN